MKGFDYAKKVFYRVRPARLLPSFAAGGKTITQTAYELGVSAAALYNWVRQEAY